MQRPNSSRPAANLRLLEVFFKPFVSFPFDESGSKVYGRLRDDLARKGTPIGPDDLMIAAIAVANELTLVTANTHEFSRVVGLSYENWDVFPAVTY